MKKSINVHQLRHITSTLEASNTVYTSKYPGDSEARQPLHTVYGGAQLFKANTAKRLGEKALQAFEFYAETPEEFANAVGMFEHAPGNHELAKNVYERVREKLKQEAVEDFRIDFEDGFGHRPDAEEDEAAANTATEVAKGMQTGELPAFLGIRIKSLSEELKDRSIRTLDIFLTTLLSESGGKLPDNFVVTLPKVPIPAQVSALCDALDIIERENRVHNGSVKVELMIELPQTIFDDNGNANLLNLVRAARGRCTGAHFGTYDYTASCNITAEHQVMDHPSCDFAKHMMQIALAQTGVFLSDGATNIMPVGPHKGADLTEDQLAENKRVVHQAWRTAYMHIRHSLVGGFYQGWDLHPGQIPIRYAACFAFFLESLEAASTRLKNFIDKAAQATLVGDVFDDAATGQGLLNYFLRAYNSGAITLDEVQATGLTEDEIRTRSFLKILDGRKAR